MDAAPVVRLVDDAAGRGTAAVARAVADPGHALPGLRPPAVTGAAFVAPGGVATPSGLEPLSVVVSDDPLVRIQQAKSFFMRNPGTYDLVGSNDALRSVGKLVTRDAKVAGVGEVTSYGLGQGFVDQVRWQIRTGRQPLDRWWMAMNKRSLEDPLLAEAYVRAGRSGELRAPELTAWARFIELDDAMQARLHIATNQGYLGAASITPSGVIPAAQLAPAAAHDAPLRTRLSLAVGMLGARKAYWTAHNLSIQKAFDEFRPLLDESRRLHPHEAQLQESWGRFIEVVPKVSPPGNGSMIDLIQPWILPQSYPARPGEIRATQQMFMRLGRLVGRGDA